MKSILSSDFKYIPSHSTDLKKKFAKIRRQQKKQQQQNVKRIEDARARRVAKS